MKKITKTNNRTLELMEKVKEHAYRNNSDFWRRINTELQRSNRRTREINLHKLNKVTKENEIVFVPGKVLGTGSLNHKLSISAFSFSDAAREKLKGNIVSVHDLMKKDPQGKKVRIIG